MPSSSAAIPMPEVRPRPTPLAALWFGLQFVWGALLAVSLQSRSAALAPQSAVWAYALIAAIGALVATLVQLVVGPLSDRSRARAGTRVAFYRTGVVLAVPAIVWFYLAPDYTNLVAAFFLVQFAMNVATGPYQAVIPDYVAPDEAGAASSRMSVFQSLGNAGGLLAAGFIADLRVVAAVLVAMLLGSYAITARHIARLRPHPVRSVRVRIDAPFRTLLASRGAINLGFYTLLGFLFFYVKQSLNVSDVRTQTALLFLTFTLCGVAGALIAARPADRFDKRGVVIVANGLVAIALITLALTGSLGVAYFAAAVAGTAWGAYFTADWALACTLLPRNAMGAAMGVWNVASAAPQIVAPLLAAPLVEKFNARSAGSGPRAAIVLAIVEFTIGALWLYRLPPAAGAGERAA